MDECHEVTAYDNDVFDVVDINQLPSFFDLDETRNDEIDVFSMTSLGALMLVGQSASKSCSDEGDQDEDSNLHRLSLAYERLHTMPKLLLQELSPIVRILDISNNEFENLDFLGEFHQLTSLICDHNNITSNTSLPYLPKLDLLWMNHCKISELYPWARKLHQSCPNLKYLSLMGNPVAPSYLNGGNFYEYLQYRLFIISLFPNLIHLDDKIVTQDQRKEAERLYHRPLVERLMSKTQNTIPYLRSVSEKVTEILTPSPPFSVPKKNFIV